MPAALITGEYLKDIECVKQNKTLYILDQKAKVPDGHHPTRVIIAATNLMGIFSFGFAVAVV